jgi:hypothetical protein
MNDVVGPIAASISLLMSQVAHQQRRVPACFSPPFGEVRIEEKRAVITQAMGGCALMCRGRILF